MAEAPFQQRTRPLVLAHRGDSAGAPGNTLLAFSRAVEQGADVLELDIHHTKDGVIVVSHDDVVDSMSNGTGRIRDIRFADIQALDFGYQYTTDGGQTYPYRDQGIRMARLEEVLEAFPAMRFNIDIKPKRFGLFKQLFCELDRWDALNRVMLASFHRETLNTVRSMNRQVATSASPIEVSCFQWRKVHRRVPFNALQVPFRFVGLPVVTPSLIAKAHNAGIEVHVWTVDDASTMTHLLNMGVDGIVTNYPGRAVHQRALYAASRRCWSEGVGETASSAF